MHKTSIKDKIDDSFYQEEIDRLEAKKDLADTEPELDMMKSYEINTPLFTKDNVKVFCYYMLFILACVAILRIVIATFF